MYFRILLYTLFPVAAQNSPVPQRESPQVHLNFHKTNARSHSIAHPQVTPVQTPDAALPVEAPVGSMFRKSYLIPGKSLPY